LRGIPGITKIPILRDLFASNDKQLQEKDIIFTITPHILRTPNITAEDLAPIWIGTEDDVRLKNAPPISVFDTSQRKEEKTIEDLIKEQTPQKTEQPAPQTKPVVPPAPIPQENPPQVKEQKPVENMTQPPPSVVKPAEPVTPGPSPAEEESREASAVSLSFLSPNTNPKVEQDVILHLRAENAGQLANAFLFLEYDPTAIQVKDVLQGAFMTPGAFAKSFDNGRGTININATHVPSNVGAGVIATIVLKVLKPGQTTIKLNSAVLRTENASVIPVTFVPFTLMAE
jgi:general secretion pathway protein D